MRTLYLSIIITVFGALFFINWGVNKLAEHSELKQNISQENASTVIYRKLINGLSVKLDKLNEEKIAQEVKKFTQEYQINCVLVLSKNIALPSSLHKQLQQKSGLLLATENSQYLLKRLTKHNKYLLQLDLPIEQVQDSSINFILTLILYLSSCIVLILWLLPLTRRLYLLNNAAAKIGAGQLDVRIRPSKFSYIKILEKSFNSMANQIEKLIADNKILARSLSHDIRTPMACLRFGIEAALDCPTLEKKDNYLKRMDHELTRMEEMTSAFLDYASMERQALRLNKKNTVIHELIQSVINDCSPLAEQKNINIQYNTLANKKLGCSLDYHWCSRALTNLISNAIGYAKAQVLLNVNIVETQLTINVEDDGKGIDKDKLAIIFTPFVKLDAERSREQGHFGLGLAICAKVMNWHHGDIIASNSKQLNGACFTLKFPITQR